MCHSGLLGEADTSANFVGHRIRNLDRRQAHCGIAITALYGGFHFLAEQGDSLDAGYSNVLL